MTELARTFGDLKRLLATCPRGEWPSRNNRAFTHTQALQVLSDGIASYPDEMLITEAVRGDLYRRNVLREVKTR